MQLKFAKNAIAKNSLWVFMKSFYFFVFIFTNVKWRFCAILFLSASNNGYTQKRTPKAFG